MKLAKNKIAVHLKQGKNLNHLFNVVGPLLFVSLERLLQKKEQMKNQMLLIVKWYWSIILQVAESQVLVQHKLN